MTDHRYHIIIPARYASQRLPGKVLADIAGEPLIVRVWRQALRTRAASVVVATDDERIAEVIRRAGGEAVMTASHHPTGSDRLAEAAGQLGLGDTEVIVNVQGDEPLIPARAIEQVARRAMAESDIPVTTLALTMDDPALVFDPNVVKVVRDARGRALYFSRAPIPWNRNTFSGDRALPPDTPYLRHIGLYAYRSGFLARLCREQPAGVESAEHLEQLRVLHLGESIAVEVFDGTFPPGVDTLEDLERTRNHFMQLDTGSQ